MARSFLCFACSCLALALLVAPAAAFLAGVSAVAGRRPYTSAAAPAAHTAPLRMTVPSDLAGSERLNKFLRDCELLGPVRFVIISDGAILESVGNFENLRFNELEKGTYATLSDEEGEFECHLNTDKVSGITMLTKPSKDGQSELYITRFIDAQGKTLLSCMLHAHEGKYEEGVVSYWQKLKDAFGAEQKIR